MNGNDATTFAEMVRPENSLLTNETLRFTPEQQKSAVAVEYISYKYMGTLILAHLLAERMHTGEISEKDLERLKHIEEGYTTADAFNAGWEDLQTFAESLKKTDDATALRKIEGFIDYLASDATDAAGKEKAHPLIDPADVAAVDRKRLLKALKHLADSAQQKKIKEDGQRFTAKHDLDFADANRLFTAHYDDTPPHSVMLAYIATRLGLVKIEPLMTLHSLLQGDVDPATREYSHPGAMDYYRDYFRKSMDPGVPEINYLATNLRQTQRKLELASAELHKPRDMAGNDQSLNFIDQFNRDLGACVEDPVSINPAAIRGFHDDFSTLMKNHSMTEARAKFTRMQKDNRAQTNEVLKTYLGALENAWTPVLNEALNYPFLLGSAMPALLKRLETEGTSIKVDDEIVDTLLALRYYNTTFVDEQKAVDDILNNLPDEVAKAQGMGKRNASIERAFGNDAKELIGKAKTTLEKYITLTNHAIEAIQENIPPDVLACLIMRRFDHHLTLLSQACAEHEKKFTEAGITAGACQKSGC